MNKTRTRTRIIEWCRYHFKKQESGIFDTFVEEIQQVSGRPKLWTDETDSDVAWNTLTFVLNSLSENEIQALENTRLKLMGEAEEKRYLDNMDKNFTEFLAKPKKKKRKKSRS